MTRRAIALLTRKPNSKWLDFLYHFKNYDIFVVIDDNTENYKKLYDVLYPKINFIQIKNEECVAHGFIDSSSATLLPRIVAWDKALLFFSTKCLDYDQIWFIEEDVFILSENVLLELDNEFREHDILSKNHNVKTEDKVLDWHWKHVNGKISLPWACSLIPICRLSSVLLKKIREYANTRGHLFFIEAMFNTLAEQNNLLIGGKDTGGKMEKFRLIDHMGDSERLINDENKMYLFHPIKDISRHQIIRERIDKQQQTVKSSQNVEFKSSVQKPKIIFNSFVADDFITRNSSTIKPLI